MQVRPLLASLLLLATFAASAATVPATSPPASAPSPVTWAADIAPLVNHSCASCHHPCGPAPFSLLTYPQVQAHALQIAQVTASRYMPPWLPDASGVPLAHSRRLTDAQVALFQQWNAEGAPKGDSADAPEPPKLASGWILGTPDRLVKMPQPYTLPAETTSPFRCFVLPLSLSKDHWLRAIQFRPGNPAVVRHATIFVDTTGTARKLQADSGAVGYVAVNAGLGANADRLAEWSVGSGPWVLPPGTAEELPAHSDLVLVLRFETDGQPEPVQSQVGLYYSAQAPSLSPAALTLGSRSLILQPGQTGTVSDAFTLPVAAQLWRMTPDGHPICRTLQVTAKPSSGPAQTLLKISDWKADWQDSYQPATPLLLPAGTRLAIRWSVDNTRNNPRNPSSPPMTAQTGLNYLQDMATVRFSLLPQSPADTSALKQAIHSPHPPVTVTLTAPDRHG